jgi:hypothetical protein
VSIRDIRGRLFLPFGSVIHILRQRLNNLAWSRVTDELSMIVQHGHEFGEQVTKRFCRRCGYDLSASANRCPECGQPFDTGNPRTFARRPPRGIYRWIRRAGWLFLALLLLAGGVFLWFWFGWQGEQRSLAELRRHLGTPTSEVNELDVDSKSLNPWLRDRLPDAIGVYLDRVTDVAVYPMLTTDDDVKIIGRFSHLRRLSLQGDRVTDAGLAHLKSLAELEDLYLNCDHITDAGIVNLRNMRHMKRLTIEGGNMTDSGLVSIDQMPDLQFLTACQNQVTEEGLTRWMRQHPGVQVVDGPGAPLSPRGCD